MVPIMERHIVKGLRDARFGFTDMIDAARDGKEVIIIESGQNRKVKRAYKLVEITAAEAESLAEVTLPSPVLPKPDLTTLLGG